MSSSDYGQITTIVHKLQELGELLNPVKVVQIAAEVIHEVATPPPGDAGALETLAGAYRTAADAIAPVAADVRKLGNDHLPRSWSGGAAREATAVLGATADAIDRAPGVFRTAATTLHELSTEVKDQQKRHNDLHQALYDAWHDATHVGGLPIPDPTALGDLVTKVRELITGCIGVYNDALKSADKATMVFNDLAGQARAAAAVDSGLAPDDAVVLAAKVVSVAGMGDGYDDGILTTAQLADAGKKMAAMSPEDRAKFDQLLANAGSDTERAWLLKGLSAGHNVTELSAFADKIRGKDENWLGEHLSLIDRGGPGAQSRFGTDVDQFDDYTCGTTSLIVSHAETDPLYALSLTDGDPAKFDERFSAEQARVHDQTNTIWPEKLGTSPVGMADYMSKNTGTDYTWHLVDDTEQANVSSNLRQAVGAADSGHPVPMLVGGATPRHYVLVTGHQGGNVMIFEPSSGTTIAVPESDFLNGNLKGSAGFDHVQAVVVPK